VASAAVPRFDDLPSFDEMPMALLTGPIPDALLLRLLLDQRFGRLPLCCPPVLAALLVPKPAQLSVPWVACRSLRRCRCRRSSRQYGHSIRAGQSRRRLGFDDAAQRAANEEEHPTASLVGELAGGAVGLSPTTMAGSVAQKVGQRATSGA